MTNTRNLFFIGILFMAENIVAGEIDVMTRNQYLGADLAPVIAAANANDPVAFNSAVIAALQQVVANKTVERMDAQAALITERQPHVVGLQEAYVFSCNDPYGTGACNEPAIAEAFNDFLDVTLAALDGGYEATATVVNFAATVPFDFYGSGIPAYLTVMDRDVILTRHDVSATPVDFGCVKVSVDGCNYGLALPAGPFTVERGYVAVDANVGDAVYRIVNTHLEVKDSPVPSVFQEMQAMELLAVLGATPVDKMLIVVGDINSSPEDSYPLPYDQFVAAGYTDAWTLRPGTVDGATCCQPDDLSNHNSVLNERIDMIFSREIPSKVKQARVLGDKVSSKTPPPGQGLWPSDHGAVAATLQFN